MLTVLAVCLGAIALVLSVYTTWLIEADPLSERSQKMMQLAIAWLIPIVGAILIMAVYRLAEPPPRPPPSGAGDDQARGARGLVEFGNSMDGD